MEGKCVIRIVHLDVAMVLVHGFLDAFDTKSMSSFVRLVGGKAAMGILKRIFPAGIDNGYYDKRSFGPSHCGHFNISFWNAKGGFQSIVQKVAEQGRKVTVSNEVDDSMPYIHMECDPAVITLTLVAAQNGIQHFMAA